MVTGYLEPGSISLDHSGGLPGTEQVFRFGLRDAGTQIQIMEKVRPTFAFAAVGANHLNWICPRAEPCLSGRATLCWRRCRII